MSVELTNLEMGKRWVDLTVERYEGYVPNMSDYHMHEYYEISLILSGDVHVLLPDTVSRGTEPRLLLTGPMTPHLVICEPHLLYRRVNVLFTGQTVAEYVPEWRQLLSVFGKQGRIMTLSVEQEALLASLIENVEQETSPFRRRLHVLCLLSMIGELSELPGTQAESLPHYVSDALSYVQSHYRDKILAADLATTLGVSRTTLMTAFKHYTGMTLGAYLIQCRIRHAIALLREGVSEHEIAEQCGFGDPCNLIRCFRRAVGKTPKQYLRDGRAPSQKS